MAEKFTIENARYAIKLSEALEEIDTKLLALQNIGTFHFLVYDKGDQIVLSRREKATDDVVSARLVATLVDEYRKQRRALLAQMNAIGFEVPS